MTEQTPSEQAAHAKLFAAAARRFAETIDKLATVLGPEDAATAAMTAALNRSTLTAPEIVAYLRQLADSIERDGRAPTLN